MTQEGNGRVRCAIYTRVSTEQGLDQDFNSLDAQYEASQAYIRSQAHAGWSLVRMKYDDGGFSGGNTERPALQRLLQDVRTNNIDVIVVYKVDRLTRSLADFAKLVELFDQHNVSFVSVTQQFNTTTSMGRLTLNVLLSFAQFEREVTSERIRDKVAASKRKGLWVGGRTPIGYTVKDRKVVLVEPEAETVRTIFRLYLKLGSIGLLLAELRKRKIVTTVRITKSGRQIGGIPFTRGPLAHVLRNRFYVGQVDYKGEILAGEQPPIVDRKLFDGVQAKLNQQRNNGNAVRTGSEALLIGKIFDERGNRMTPSHTRKRGAKYRYYISSGLTQGQAQRAGKPQRMPAAEIEAAVAKAIQGKLKNGSPSKASALIDKYVDRVTVHADRLVIALKGARESRRSGARIETPWTKTAATRRREVLLPANQAISVVRPIRSEYRTRLVTAMARGRCWLRELIEDPKASVESIATREGCTTRKVNMIISLAFLAPDLVKAAIDGRLPHGFGLTRLSDLPSEWPLQYRALGLASHSL
jgi:site-specific DNA recombinase